MSKAITKARQSRKPYTPQSQHGYSFNKAPLTPGASEKGNKSEPETTSRIRLNQPEVPQTKKFGWRICFCCDTRRVEATDFLVDFYAKQLCHDCMFIFLAGFLLFLSIAGGDDNPNFDRVVIIYLIVSFISIIVNCMASCSIQEEEKKRSYSYYLLGCFYYLAILFGIMVSTTCAMAFFTFVVWVFADLLFNPQGSGVDPVATFGLFLCVVSFFLGIFSLCQSVMGFIACRALWHRQTPTKEKAATEL